MKPASLTRIASIFLIDALLAGHAAAQSAPVEREIFPPAQGKGAIVVVISGGSRADPRAPPVLYRDFSSKLAKSEYYTVLIKGTDVFPSWGIYDQQGLATLQTVIADSQSASQAIPGKVAVIGLSLGGAAALLYGGPLKDQVSAIVAFYPALNRLTMDMKTLAAGLKVPVLVLAGERDNNDGCCMIDTMRALDAAPKTVALELVVYPNAGHGFNLHDPRFNYREEDAAEAWARTLAFLSRLHPPRGDKSQ
jgi:pimeloyl-ACP methyl ester carboxylesterase